MRVGAASDNADAAAGCEHCTFHEHVQLFAAFGTVTAFFVQPIRPLHVHFAPMQCTIVEATASAPSLTTDSETQPPSEDESPPPSQDAPPIVLRENTDEKGRTSPDIGSVSFDGETLQRSSAADRLLQMISHALASREYTEKRRLAAAAYVERQRKRASSSATASSAGSLVNSQSWAANMTSAAVSTSAAHPAAYAPSSSFLAPTISGTSLAATTAGSASGGGDTAPLPVDDPNVHAIEVEFADARAHYYVRFFAYYFAFKKFANWLRTTCFSLES